MKIISFAWTTPALLALRKTVTRRDWKEKYASGFHAGDEVQAWDKLPRNHGRPIATIELTAEPSLEPYAEMPDDDYEAEGFKFFEEHPEFLPADAPWSTMNRQVFDQSRRDARGRRLWVIRFRLVESLVSPAALKEVLRG